MQDDFSGETLIVTLKKAPIITSISVGSVFTLFFCFVTIYVKAYTMAIYALLFFSLTLYHLIGELKMAQVSNGSFLILTKDGIDFYYKKWLVVKRVYLPWSEILSLEIEKTHSSEFPEGIFIETFQHSYNIVVDKAAIDKNVKEIYAFINKYSKPNSDS